MTERSEGVGAGGIGRSAVRSVLRVPSLALIGLLRFYQRFISPLTPPTCKYYPSCSSYAVTALRRHGALRGTGLAVWRVLRCHPWAAGGVDDVPPVLSHQNHRQASSPATSH